MSFVYLMQVGGFGMYPVLALGLAAIGTGGYFAARGDARTRAFLELMLRALVWTMIGSTVINFQAVFHYISGDSVTAESATRLLHQGTFEALSPVPFASGFLVVSYLLLAVGQRRVDARLGV